MKKLNKKQRIARAKKGQEGYMKKTTKEWRSENAKKAALARWAKV